MVLLRHSSQGLGLYLYSKVGMGLGCGKFYVVFISRHFVLAGGTTNGYNYTLLSISKGGVWGFPPHIVAITIVNIPKEYSSGS